MRLEKPRIAPLEESEYGEEQRNGDRARSQINGQHDAQTGQKTGKAQSGVKPAKSRSEGRAGCPGFIVCGIIQQSVGTGVASIAAWVDEVLHHPPGVLRFQPCALRHSSDRTHGACN